MDLHLTRKVADWTSSSITSELASDRAGSVTRADFVIDGGLVSTL